MKNSNLNTPPKAVTIGGRKYSSILKAAKDLGISRSRISKEVKLKGTELDHIPLPIIKYKKPEPEEHPIKAFTGQGKNKKKKKAKKA